MLLTLDLGSIQNLVFFERNCPCRN